MPLPRGDGGGRSAGGGADETTPLAPNASDGSTTPKRRPAAQQQQQQGNRQAAAKGEETVEKKMSKAMKLGIYVAASTFTAAANSVLFKQLTNSYRPHYTFFANQMNVALYVALAALVVVQRRVKYGAHWWRKQDLPLGVVSFMGALDATGSMLSTIGGAYTAGAVQTLLNQVIIPMTLALSFLFLGQRFTWAQTLGALVIFVGAAVAVVPSFLESDASTDTDGDGAGASTATGVLLFFSSIVPGAVSNVYKEWGFQRYHADLYYLTTAVSSIQVLFGFAFLPFLQTKAFGGVPLRQIPRQCVLGYRCFQGINSLPDDDCGDAARTMIGYVLVNFLFNILQLLITKHGGATLLVISAALALPVTNVAFKLRCIMGDDVEPMDAYDFVALLIVLGGFLLYATYDDVAARHALEPHKRLPIQFAAGSVMYLRERSNSDPSTPGYTPLRVEPPRRRGSIDLQLQRAGSFVASQGAAGQGTPSRLLLQPSKAIPILQQQQRKRGAGVGAPPGSYQIRILEPHHEEISTVSI